MLKFIEKWLNKNGFYAAHDLRAGCHCGTCGKWLPHKIGPKDWAIAICDECLKEGEVS